MMFLKVMVQMRASSGSIAPSLKAIVPPADTGPAESCNDDALSQCSQDSSLLVSNQLPAQEATDNLPEIQECSVSQDAGPSFETQVRSKRKRKSKDDDYYEKLCKIEQKKLDILSDREARRKSDADREDEDLMFLKTLLPHIRKIPQHMKLRFQSRILSVVEEFAYGPQPAMYQSYTYSSTPSPVDSNNYYSHSDDIISTNLDNPQVQRHL
ncbi:transcription factor adf-1 [Plakobranchus ocellatus]|uniref:Transcription factor adf-1 n=1 Tax=Plakobranchus ocellatus TaxID=259542 RepID=A0AAV3YDA9_9GAST|nr:transcription factor adf-1 [Plakobranchus ocellatus]